MTKEQLLQREIYDILRDPEHQKQFIRMMAEMIAKYVMIARTERMDLIGEDKSHPFAESVMMGMDGGENDS